MHNKCFFLIPGRLDRPVGGHKVIYQYANFLIENSWDVVIVNNIFQPSQEKALIECFRIAYAFVRYLWGRISGNITCRKWFPLSSRVQERTIWSFDKLELSKTDYCVATDATTSPYVNNFQIDNNHKVYFIQHFENWRMTDAQLRQTYHFNMKRVVISKWLGEILNEEGVEYVIVPNGFDRNEFYMTIPIVKKNRYLASMLYHKSPWKNVQLGMAALDIVKRRIPQLRVVMFGVYDKPGNLPEWYEYVKKPTIEEHNMLNNQAAIFIGSSLEEGWGLTVGEAMLCGQAVCCTNAAGYLEMAKHGETALVSDRNDVESLAENIISLIEDNEKRYCLAKGGIDFISQFEVNESCKRFMSVLES